MTVPVPVVGLTQTVSLPYISCLRTDTTKLTTVVLTLLVLTRVDRLRFIFKKWYFCKILFIYFYNPMKKFLILKVLPLSNGHLIRAPGRFTPQDALTCLTCGYFGRDQCWD